MSDRLIHRAQKQENEQESRIKILRVTLPDTRSLNFHSFDVWLYVHMKAQFPDQLC